MQNALAKEATKRIIVRQDLNISKSQRIVKKFDKVSKSVSKRPHAAVKERERLRVFNEALESLQGVIPVSLPKGRKLHKKQTIQLACRYIQFLKDCLDGHRDWSERRRFWCGSEEDHNMIDAIDAAAAAGGAFVQKHGQSQKCPKEENPPVSFETAQLQSDLNAPSYSNVISTKINSERRRDHVTLVPGQSHHSAPESFPLICNTQKDLRMHQYGFGQQPSDVTFSDLPFLQDIRSNIKCNNIILSDNIKILESTGQMKQKNTITSYSSETTMHYQDSSNLDDVWMDIDEIITENESTNQNGRTFI